MKFSTSSIIMAGLATIASAAPTADASSTSAEASKFFLVVQSKDNRVTSKCANGYHTGAGMSDTIIQQCGPAPEKGFTFMDNKINFLGYGNGIQSNMNAQGGGLASYDNWGSVVLNAGDVGSNFTYDSTNGFVQQENGLGFLACMWAHDGEWQLFALSSKDAPVLPNCAKVTLKQGCYNIDPNCVNNTY